MARRSRSPARLMEQEADATFRRCVANAHDDVDTVVAIGTLPTLRDSDLSSR